MTNKIILILFFPKPNQSENVTTFRLLQHKQFFNQLTFSNVSLFPSTNRTRLESLELPPLLPYPHPITSRSYVLMMDSRNLPADRHSYLLHIQGGPVTNVV